MTLGSNGGFEISASVGFGYGGGIKIDPNGQVSGTGTSGTVVNWKAGADATAATPVGGFSVGAEGKVTLDNGNGGAVTNSGDSKFGFSPSGGPFSLNFGTSATVEFGFYDNQTRANRNKPLVCGK
jgi:hypothetical protein